MSAEDGVEEVARTGFIGAHKHPGIFALRWTPYPSAYVSIRQHTSAYVSRRQHTSAYV
jgi:hypothetical protein